MIFGGDFRQILSVVKIGNRLAIVNSSFKHAAFWPDVTKLRLTENMEIIKKIKPNLLKIY